MLVKKRKSANRGEGERYVRGPSKDRRKTSGGDPSPSSVMERGEVINRDPGRYRFETKKRAEFVQPCAVRNVGEKNESGGSIWARKRA